MISIKDAVKLQELASQVIKDNKGHDIKFKPAKKKKESAEEKAR